MAGKKGFEIQFNWMFVLVAGALILLFFAALVINQKGISDASARNAVLKSIEAVISGASVSTDTTSVLETPNIEISPGCNKISSGKVSKPYQNMILLGPEVIKGNRILTHTLAFSAPFRSGNLLYITSLSHNYAIIGDNAFAQEINRSLPQELRKSSYDSYSSLVSVRGVDNYKIRVIVLDETNLDTSSIASSLRNIKDEDITAIKIDGNPEKGTLKFYQKKDSSWESTGESAYIGKASLIGAIYAGNHELYECNMRNAFLRHKLTSSVYLDKVNRMKDQAQASQIRPECRSIYANSINPLRDINEASSNLAEDSAFDASTINALSNAARLLSIQNKEAQKRSCPMIY